MKELTMDEYKEAAKMFLWNNVRMRLYPSKIKELVLENIEIKSLMDASFEYLFPEHEAEQLAYEFYKGPPPNFVSDFGVTFEERLTLARQINQELHLTQNFFDKS